MSEITHPISWLKLEQYHVGELPESSRKAVEAHLKDCSECRACMTTIEAGRRLKPLPDVATESFLDRWRLPLQLAMAASVLLLIGVVVYPRFFEQPPEEIGSIETKGGETALTLLRERKGEVVENPAAYQSGDRFSMRLTTSKMDVPWDAVVLMDDEIYFPLKNPLIPEFQNQFPIPGAFRLTGESEATICVFPSQEPDVRISIMDNGREGLPDGAVCRSVTP